MQYLYNTDGAELTEDALNFIGASLVCRRNGQLVNVNRSCIGANPECWTMILSCKQYLQHDYASFVYKTSTECYIYVAYCRMCCVHQYDENNKTGF